VTESTAPDRPVVHMVLTRWKPDAPSDALESMRALARQFPITIPGVLEVAEGPSSSPEGLEAGYTWALVVTFRDAHARDAYLTHPAHLPVADVIGEYAEQLVVYDLDA
jgi:Stress responsive A/B Barrel Domain